MSLKIKNKIIEFKTKKGLQFIDFTKKIESFVKEAKIKNGLVNIQSLHTTAVLIVNENEPLLIDDMKKNFRNIAKKKAYYGHNDFAIRTVNMCDDECKNGHSHCLAAYMPTSVTLNLVNSKLNLGQWQKIFLIELDHARLRKVQMQIMGE